MFPIIFFVFLMVSGQRCSTLEDSMDSFKSIAEAETLIKQNLQSKKKPGDDAIFAAANKVLEQLQPNENEDLVELVKAFVAIRPIAIKKIEESDCNQQNIANLHILSDLIWLSSIDRYRRPSVITKTFDLTRDEFIINCMQHIPKAINEYRKDSASDESYALKATDVFRVFFDGVLGTSGKSVQEWARENVKDPKRWSRLFEKLKLKGYQIRMYEADGKWMYNMEDLRTTMDELFKKSCDATEKSESLMNLLIIESKLMEEVARKEDFLAEVVDYDPTIFNYEACIAAKEVNLEDIIGVK